MTNAHIIPDQADFALSTFRNWVMITAQAFQDEVGLEQGLAILEPYSKNSGIAINNNWIKMYPDLKDMEGAAKIFQLTINYMGIKNRSFINKYGFYCKIIDCPYRSGPQIICYMHMWQCPRYMVTHLGLDLDLYLLKKLSADDDICLNVVTDQKDPTVVLTYEPTKEIMVDPLPLPEQQRLLALWATDIWEYFMMAYSDLVGPERCLNELKPKFRSSGLNDLDRLLKQNNRNRENVTVPEVVDLLLSMYNIEAVVTRNKEGGIEVKVTSCPFSRSRQDMCELLHAYMEGSIHGIDLKCTLHCLEKMTGGTDHCTLIVPSIDRDGGSKPTMDDVVLQLKMRLAKGEINKTEYEELFSIIKQ